MKREFSFQSIVQGKNKSLEEAVILLTIIIVTNYCNILQRQLKFSIVKTYIIEHYITV